MNVRIGAAAFGAAVVTAVSPATGQVPLGPPFTVNTATAGDQFFPDVAVRPDGGFVVVWRSDQRDREDWDVVARWFAWDGTALTGEVQVNGTATGDQSPPRVDSDRLGRFVFAWVNDARGIVARRFDRTGGPLSGEIEVTASSAVARPSVSATADGRFVVAWLHTGSPDFQIEARRYTANGLPIGDAFVVATFGNLGWQMRTAVEVNDDGSFLVVWGDGEEIFARRCDAAGNPIGAAVQVSLLDPMSFVSFDPDVGSDGAGEYRVFWSTDINLEEVVSMTRTVTTSGTLGSLTSLGHPSCRPPAFSMTAGGDFVVTYFPFYGEDLGATRYDRDLNVLSDFVIAPNPDFYLSGAALAHGDSDSRELVAVWAEPPSDPFDRDIRARIFSARVFGDGFESGDTTAWEASVPESPRSAATWMPPSLCSARSIQP